jgi:membrane-bound lytic murein transglycosylase D
VADDPDHSPESGPPAKYLAGLLAEFGEDAFMLAMASYNKGENGVRRVLRKVAQTPGGFKKSKRDFWHLYRLKLLPVETREYVPKILAAAIVCSNPIRYGLTDATVATVDSAPPAVLPSVPPARAGRSAR